MELNAEMLRDTCEDKALMRKVLKYLREHVMEEESGTTETTCCFFVRGRILKVMGGGSSFLFVCFCEIVYLCRLKQRYVTFFIGA